jgi:hypothetical protein
MKATTMPAAVLLIVALTAVIAGGAVTETQDFQVNGFTPGNQANPAVAVGAGGNFLVVWDSEVSAGTDTDGSSIQGRLLAADGTPLTDDFQVNTVTPGDQLEPAVAATPGGDFVVVWRSLVEGGVYVRTVGVHLQLVQGNGAPAGGEFVVQSLTDNYCAYGHILTAPGVAVAGGGCGVGTAV